MLNVETAYKSVSSEGHGGIIIPVGSNSTDYNTSLLPTACDYFIDLSVPFGEALDFDIVSYVSDCEETTGYGTPIGASEIDAYMIDLGFTVVGTFQYQISSAVKWQSMTFIYSSSGEKFTESFTVLSCSTDLVGVNYCIGTYYDHRLNMLVWFNYNTAGRHNIQSADYTSTPTNYRKILETPLLDFQFTNRIASVDLVLKTADNGNEEWLLYWTDGINPPRKINIQKSLQGDYWNDPLLFYRTPDEWMRAVKYPPIYLGVGADGTPTNATVAVVTPFNDPTKAYNNLSGRSFQFRYRYLYDDRDRSVFSADTPLVYTDFVGCGLSGSVSADNGIRIESLSAGSSIVRKVEIAYREGNESDWRSYDILDKEQILALSSYDIGTNRFDYEFFLDKGYSPLAPEEVNPDYDNHPELAGAQEYLTNNRIAYGDITEGKNDLSLTERNKVTIDVEYEEIATAPLRDITFYLVIHNRNTNGSDGMNQPIYQLFGTDGTAFGGIGTTTGNFVSDTIASYKQSLSLSSKDAPNPSLFHGFNIYLAGTGYNGTTTQYYWNSIDFIQTGDLQFVNNAPQSILDQCDPSGGYLPFVQKVTIKAPAGKYIARVASHLTTDVSSTTFQGQSTHMFGTCVLSDYLNGTLTIDSRPEILIDCSEGDVSLDQYNCDLAFIVADLTNTDSDMTVAAVGYLNEPSTPTAVELSLVNTTADYSSFQTDHNGYFWATTPLSSSTAVPINFYVEDGAGSVAIGATCSTGVVGTSEFTVNVDNSLLSADYNIYGRTKIIGQISANAGVDPINNVPVLFTGSRPTYTDVNGVFELVVHNQINSTSTKERYDDLMVSHPNCALDWFFYYDEPYDDTRWAFPAEGSYHDACTNAGVGSNNFGFGIYIAELQETADTGNFIYNDTDGNRIQIDGDSAGIIVLEVTSDVPYTPMRAQPSDHPAQLKLGGRYEWGLLMHDEAGRHGGVQILPNAATYIESIVELGGVFHPVLTINLNGCTFPSWVKYVSFVRTKNLMIQRYAQPWGGYLQWALANVKFQDEANHDVSSPQQASKIYFSLQGLNTFNANNFFKTTTSYTYTEGDRIQFILNGDGVLFTEIIEAVLRSEDSVDFRIDYDSRLQNLTSNAVAQIYSPNVEQPNQIYYEVTAPISVSNGSLVFTDFIIDTFDTYLLTRTIPQPNLSTPDDDTDTIDFSSGMLYEHYARYDTVPNSWGEDIGRPEIEIPDASRVRKITSYRYSNVFLPQSNINGLSTFPVENYGVLLQSKGAIRQMCCIQSSLNFIHENDVTVTRLGRQDVQFGGGNVPLTAPNVIISEPIDGIRGGYGTQDPSTFIENNGLMFFYDVNQGCAVSFNGQACEPISKYGLGHFFNQQSQRIQHAKNSYSFALGVPQIHAGFDPFRFRYVLTTFIKTNGIRPTDPYINNSETLQAADNITVSWDMERKCWVSFLSFTPEAFGYTSGSPQGALLISFKNGIPYNHNRRGTTTYNTFFDTEVDQVLEVPLNENPQTVKRIMNLNVNSYVPNSALQGIRYAVDNITTVEGQTSYVPIDAFKWKGGVYWSSFFRDTSYGGTIASGSVLSSTAANVRLIRDTTKRTEYNELKQVAFIHQPNAKTLR